MDGASLRVNMCSAINAASQKAWAFAPYPSDTPDMLVHLWPGALLVDGQPVEVATQATGAFAAPTVHPRIDRIVIDARTGALAVVAGVEAATPARPNVPAGKLPVARVRFSVGMTAISEGDIDDERVDSGGAPLGSLTSPSPYDAASTQDVVTAISAIPQADLVARDQCALLYLFIMLSTAISTGALVQGKQWKLAIDEWVANNTAAQLVVDTINYYANKALGSLTNIPAASMAQQASAYTFGAGTISYAGAGNAGFAFQSTSKLLPAGDFDLSMTLGTTFTSSYDGAMFGVATNQMTSLNYQPSSAGSGLGSDGFFFSVNGTGSSQTIKIYQGQTVLTTLTGQTVTSGDVFAIKRRSGALTLWHNGTQIATFTGYSSTAAQYFIGGNYGYMGNWTGVSYAALTTANGTYINPTLPLSAVPTYADAYFLWKDDSGSATLGTDFTVELSRDGGTTWTTATLTSPLGSAGYDGSYTWVKARANLSSQPSGTSLKMRAKTLNTKAQRFAAPSLYAE